MGIYDTPEEKRNIETLEALGLEVFNPNTPKVQKEVEDIKGTVPYMKMFDVVFFKQLRICEVFAFKALPDGRIPGGVAMELAEAKKCNKIIIELPSGIHSRSMDKDETREYLHDIGQR